MRQETTRWMWKEENEENVTGWRNRTNSHPFYGAYGPMMVADIVNAKENKATTIAIMIHWQMNLLLMWI